MPEHRAGFYTVRMANHADKSCCVSGGQSLVIRRARACVCRYQLVVMRCLFCFQMTDLAGVNHDEANITVELDALLVEVRQCIERCQQHGRVPGMGKLERKFRAEDRFLKRVRIRKDVLVETREGCSARGQRCPRRAGGDKRVELMRHAESGRDIRGIRACGLKWCSVCLATRW